MEGTTTTPTSFTPERVITKYATTSRRKLHGASGPTKNVYFCTACGRSKMLFRTQQEAELFMRYNSENIKDEAGYAPIRAYYCESCGGYHITSQTEEERQQKKKFREKLSQDHLKASQQKLKTRQRLAQVQELLSYASNSRHLGRPERASRLFHKAFVLFQHCLHDESNRDLKLQVFNQLAQFHDLALEPTLVA